MFRYLRNNHWILAYRDNTRSEQFIILPNPPWAWVADPFLVEYRNKIYVFAELFLYKSERKGVLGYCNYEDGRFTEWTVTMDKKWHLSYPNVFTNNNELYMCPESYQREEIGIYKLIEFPDKWIKVKTFRNNCQCVDTTFLEVNEKVYMFTYQIDGVEFGKLISNQIDLNDGSISEDEIISGDIALARPGGNFLEINGMTIRVSQDCSKRYGDGLVFSQVDSLEPYSEHILCKKYPQDFLKDENGIYTGVHTYNRLQNLEIIDLRFETKSFAEHFARKRVRKVFTDKY